MPDLDELLDKVKVEGLTPELETQVRAEVTNSVPFARETIKRLEGQIADLKPKADLAEKYEREPKVREAFEAQGFDWDQMKPLERKQALAFTDWEDGEKVAEFGSSEQLPAKKADDEATEQPNAAQIQNAGSQVPAPDAPTDMEKELKAAKSPEEVVAVMEKYNRPVATD